MKSALLALFLFLPGLGLGRSVPFDLAGRYKGVLHNERLQRDQWVQIDILVSNEGDEDRRKNGGESQENRFEFLAFLKLQFGGWNSSEYMTYHFDDVVLNEETETLPLVHPDQEVSIVLKMVKPGTLQGTFRSNYGGDVGELIVSKTDEIPLKFPLLQPLAGEYEGFCADGTKHKVQVATFRNTDDTTKIGNPFASYRIHANWGTKDDLLCFKDTEYCVVGVFDKGTYNFFDNDLVLMGPRKTVKCQATVDGLLCLNCDLKRKQFDPTLGRENTKHPDHVFPGRPEIKTSDPKSVGGIYRGYLYHEYLNLYQRAEINIQSFFQPGEEAEGEISMSAVAQLYFGEYSQREAISYRFATRTFPIHQSPFRFSFQRPQADLDAVLYVEEIGEGVIRGAWYSLLFGRVGPFEMRKEDEVSIDNEVPIAKAVSGFYKGPQWDLNLLVELGQTPYNSDNPFHPLTFSGWTQLRGLGLRETILDGSYDIYTGKLGIMLADGSDLVGMRNQRGELHIKKVGHLYGTPLKPFHWVPYEFVSSDHPF